MTTIVGLGNPGATYAGTRHNVGFRVVEELAKRDGLLSLIRLGEMNYAVGKISGEKVLLVQPLTFMNRSGEAVARLFGSFEAVGGDGLIVVHDDMDLALGDVRIKRGGGHGGHNGLRSILEVEASGAFLRVRLGVGRPAAGNAAEWVLSRFSADEVQAVDSMLERGADAAEMIVRQGPDRTMTEMNRKRAVVASESGSALLQESR